MSKGDTVRVWPHGSEEQAATGRVILISENQKSIAVGFDDKPPFVSMFNGITVHPEFGIVMLAMRESVGPWLEMIGGGHYEIEPV